MKRKTVKSGGKRKSQRGGAWYDSLWSGIKEIAGPINSILKSTGIAGNLASAYNPTAGAAVKALGYGKMHGKGKKVCQF